MQIINFFISIVLSEWIAIFFVGFLLILITRLLIYSLNKPKRNRLTFFIPIFFMFNLLLLIYFIPTIYTLAFREFDNQLVPMISHF